MPPRSKEFSLKAFVLSMSVIVAAIFAGFIFLKNQKGKMINRIDQNPAYVTGVVIEKMHFKGRSVKVKYDVDGVTYELSEGVSMKQFGSVNENSTLLVKYDKRKPGNAIVIWD